MSKKKKKPVVPQASFETLLKRLEERKQGAPTKTDIPQKSYKQIISAQQSLEWYARGEEHKNQLQKDHLVFLETKKQIELMKADLYNKIAGDYPSLGVDGVMKKYSDDLSKLETSGDKLIKMYKSSQPRHAFAHLIYELASKLDLGFLLYDKNRALIESEINLKDMPEDLRPQLQEYFGGENMSKKYIKYFPDLIHLMDYNNAKYVLRTHPSRYSQINNSVKQELENNVYLYADLLLASPALINYYNEEEIYQASFVKINNVANALSKYPGAILNFPKDYFSKFPPNLIFQHIPKTKFAKKLEELELIDEIYLKFPKLKEYMENTTRYFVHNATI